ISPSSTKSPSLTLMALTVPATVDCTGICIFIDSSTTTSWSMAISPPVLTRNSKPTPAILDTTLFIPASIPPFYLSLACSRWYFLSLSPPLRFCGPLLLCSDVTTLCLYTTASSQENHKRLGGGPLKDTAKESR